MAWASPIQCDAIAGSTMWFHFKGTNKIYFANCQTTIIYVCSVPHFKLSTFFGLFNDNLGFHIQPPSLYNNDQLLNVNKDCIEKNYERFKTPSMECSFKGFKKKMNTLWGYLNSTNNIIIILYGKI